VEQVEVAPGGWVRYESDDPAMWVFVRFVEAPAVAQEPRTRLVPREVFVAPLDDAPATAEMLRAVPLRSIEAVVNGSSDEAKAIRERMHRRVDDVRRWFDKNVRTLPIAPSPSRRLRLEIPERRPYGDDFYRTVAELYSQEAASTRAPAAAIADENRIPLRTVQGWILRARRLGLLAAGHQGKAG
jgi:hypothetical protein